MHRRSTRHLRTGRRIAGAIVLVLAGFCTCVPDASAQTQEPVASNAVPELVAAAEWILVADLVEMPVRHSAPDHRIVTDYHFSAMRTLLGQPPSNDLVLSQDGGSLDGETQAMAKAPAFVLGARYLLFVRPGSGERLPMVVGGAQGVYRLSIDGRAMALGGEREILNGDDLLAEIDRLVAVRKAPEPAAGGPRAAERRAASGH